MLLLFETLQSFASCACTVLDPDVITVSVLAHSCCSNPDFFHIPDVHYEQVLHGSHSESVIE